ncbi:SubName: Full=Related to TFIIH basal transcription factor complex p34 subunit {ECO:0000313/EMBL:CCA72023.1} [Serendipita indica DSM 11827]|nr:SubName: Full=Related to TFIIH basal transcription factor complex p34 subunit {ECO:0000313/EMBL:CCA72023.1} [Serendipita indica DSM 11827]
MLYSSNETYIQADADSNTFQPFKTMNSVIAQRLNEELESLPEDAEAPIALVGALTKSLCTINRRSHPSDTLNATSPNPSKLPTPRLLVISVSPDLSASYIPIMNSIFCAQKLKLSIDVCKIFGPDNTTFLSPPAVRRLMAVPTEDRIDLRAACFCHKQIVDIGFICSICLSIFCKPTPVCSTCRVKFPIKTLQRLKEAVNPVLPPNIPAPKLPAEAPPATPRVMPPFSMPHPGFMPAGLFTPKKMSKIPKPAPRVPPSMK